MVLVVVRMWDIGYILSLRRRTSADEFWHAASTFSMQQVVREKSAFHCCKLCRRSHARTVCLYNEVSECWCDVDKPQTTLTWRAIVSLACLWSVYWCTMHSLNPPGHSALIKTNFLLFLISASWLQRQLAREIEIYVLLMFTAEE